MDTVSHRSHGNAPPSSRSQRQISIQPSSSLFFLPALSHILSARSSRPPPAVDTHARSDMSPGGGVMLLGRARGRWAEQQTARLCLCLGRFPANETSTSAPCGRARHASEAGHQTSGPGSSWWLVLTCTLHVLQHGLLLQQVHLRLPWKRQPSPEEEVKL